MLIYKKRMYQKKYFFLKFQVLKAVKNAIRFKNEIYKLFNLDNYKNIFVNRRKLKIGTLIFLLLPIFFQKQIFSDTNINRFGILANNINWKKINLIEENEKDIIWGKIKNNEDIKFKIKEIKKYQYSSKNNNEGISSFNRSIVFNNSIVGPDVSWLVPPGFKWNNKYKFDTSVRGHSGRFDKGRKGKSFWALDDLW